MEGDENFMDGIQSMGIVNALKTGNMFVDMCIAMCIPLLLKTLFSAVTGENLKTILDSVIEFVFGSEEKGNKTVYHEYHERTIKHVVEKDRNDNLNNIDEDSHNEILIKAITMYLHHLKCTKMRQSNLQLTTLKTGGGESDYHGGRDSDRSDDEKDEEDDTFARVLQGYSIVKNPLPNEWHEVGKKYLGRDPADKKKKNDYDAEKKHQPTKAKTGGDHGDKDKEEPEDGLYDVEFMMEETEETEKMEEEDNGRKNTIVKERREKTLCLRSLGERSIDAFISEAYKWYVAEVRRSEKDTTRYMFDLKKNSGGGGGGYNDDGYNDDGNDNNRHKFKRYKLSDEKTFDSLFFREKETIVKLFRHFLDKTGKYGIKGYPQKLGLLLHGPPGTGKTSLIKAVAEYTGRHIVNIPLDRIQTNEELSQLFFSGEYHIEGRYYPQKLGFKDVIFVMEDVDAASKVVQRRDGKKTAEVVQTQRVDLPVPKSMWMMLLESNHDDCKELVEKLIEKSERLKKNALSPETLNALAKRMGSIPRMSLVGHSQEGTDADDSKDGGAGAGESAAAESDAIQKISGDAIESGKELLERLGSVDEYLSVHARSMIKMLEMGAEVDENFENTLLGLSSSLVVAGVGPKPSRITREVSYSKYNNSDLQVETEMNPINKMAVIGEMLGGGGGFGLGGGGFGLGGGFGGLGGAKGGAKGGGGDDVSLKALGEGGGMGGGFGKGGKPSFIGLPAVNRDTLNLSGLLNVLDGVVDTPGRILVMTSNHPEKLDPALIRPGRIDKKLNLGYMQGEDVNDMLEHYFELSLAEIQKDRVFRAVKGGDNRPALRLTPAQVEQITAEHDDIEDMIEALEEKSAPLIVIPPSKPQLIGHSTRERSQETGRQEEGGGEREKERRRKRKREHDDIEDMIEALEEKSAPLIVIPPSKPQLIGHSTRERSQETGRQEGGGGEREKERRRKRKRE